MSVYPYTPEQEPQFAPPPYGFLETEHGKCKMRVEFLPNDKLALYCSSHRRSEPSRISDMRLCGNNRVILNAISPGRCGIQAIKLPNLYLPPQVRQLPQIMRRTHAVWPKNERPDLIAYLLLSCGICQNHSLTRLHPLCWTFDDLNLQLSFLMECSVCHRQAVVKFDTTIDFVACECERHPLSPPAKPVAVLPPVPLFIP